MATRMEGTLRALSERHPEGTVLAFSHGGPCAAGYRALTERAPPNSGYTALHVLRRPAGGGGAFEALLSGDVSHLVTGP